MSMTEDRGEDHFVARFIAKVALFTAAMTLVGWGILYVSVIVVRVAWGSCP